MHYSYQLYDSNNKSKTNVKKYSKTLTFFKTCDENYCSPYVLQLPRGNYQFESWGSIDSGPIPGKGAYCKGDIYLKEQVTTLYLVVGNNHGFNDSPYERKIGSYGGGASDIRLYYNNDIYSFDSLKSRIMVCAGGGGSEWGNSIGGYGGNLVGGTGYYSSYEAGGGKQTSSCQNNSPVTSGTFGYAIPKLDSNDIGGFGGGGYYAGGTMDYTGAGGGGSSFISGHEGCDAIHEDSKDFNNIIHTKQSIHYSKFEFYNTNMIDGNKTMPHFNQKECIGNNDLGAIRITFFDYCTYYCSRKESYSIYLIIIIIIINNNNT